MNSFIVYCNPRHVEKFSILSDETKKKLLLVRRLLMCRHRFTVNVSF